MKIDGQIIDEGSVSVFVSVRGNIRDFERALQSRMSGKKFSNTYFERLSKSQSGRFHRSGRTMFKLNGDRSRIDFAVSDAAADSGAAVEYEKEYIGWVPGYLDDVMKEGEIQMSGISGTIFEEIEIANRIINGSDLAEQDGSSEEELEEGVYDDKDVYKALKKVFTASKDAMSELNSIHNSKWAKSNKREASEIGQMMSDLLKLSNKVKSLTVGMGVRAGV